MPAVSDAIDRFESKAPIGGGLAQLGAQAVLDVRDQELAALGTAELRPADSQAVGNRTRAWLASTIVSLCAIDSWSTLMKLSG